MLVTGEHSHRQLCLSRQLQSRVQCDHYICARAHGDLRHLPPFAISVPARVSLGPNGGTKGTKGTKSKLASEPTANLLIINVYAKSVLRRPTRAKEGSDPFEFRGRSLVEEFCRVIVCERLACTCRQCCAPKRTLTLRQRSNKNRRAEEGTRRDHEHLNSN